MTDYIKQSIQVTEDERETLKKAADILFGIYTEMCNTPTYIIDEQDFDSSVEELVKTALQVEMGKIYSVFDCLPEENKQNIRKEICK